ncbi:hypothetical protein BSKO_14087 [Bryopsis sp. KO-2023]|nr:hypothetical protein BSKO_14087 [Bryopsis sp. KO-2023]
MPRGRNDPNNGNFWVTELLSLGLSIAGGLTMAYMAASLLDPNREERKRKREYEKRLIKRLGKRLHLSPMEKLLADAVVNPLDIDVDEGDIYGMNETFVSVRSQIVRPLTRTDLFSMSLWQQPRGVLLYGPPGTGKTMMAKVIAKTCNCFFMNVSSASIMSKWYGDAQKLVRAIFALACKLEPCIIFIDEVDAFLAARGGHSEHEATLGIKTEFMQCWEGIETRRQARILVMGATNRRDILDPAVLRRFSLQYEIPLPNERQRLQILQGYIKKHMLETGSWTGEDPDTSPVLSAEPVRDDLSVLGWVARQTEKYSGSDLHELCCQAAKKPLTELLEETAFDEELTRPPRPIQMSDFEGALVQVQPVASIAAESQELPNLQAIQALLALFAAQNGAQGGQPSKPSKEHENKR